MTDDAGITRRRALQVLGVVPVAGALGMLQAPTTQQPRQPHTTPNQPAQSTAQPQRDRSRATNHFFTTREMRTVRVLADDIIPRDDRSGSATDAGVPAFIDFHMSVEETSPADRVLMRGGLRWLDTESRRRFGVAYGAASAAQRHAILDDISRPQASADMPPALRHGAAFFARFRDLTAAGFFSSPMGWKDLQYIGNVFNPEWSGCPKEAMEKLGVTVEMMNRR